MVLLVFILLEVNWDTVLTLFVKRISFVLNKMFNKTTNYHQTIINIRIHETSLCLKSSLYSFVKIFA